RSLSRPVRSRAGIVSNGYKRVMRSGLTHTQTRHHAPAHPPLGGGSKFAKQISGRGPPVAVGPPRKIFSLRSKIFRPSPKGGWREFVMSRLSRVGTYGFGPITLRRLTGIAGALPWSSPLENISARTDAPRTIRPAVSARALRHTDDHVPLADGCA